MDRFTKAIQNARRFNNKSESFLNEVVLEEATFSNDWLAENKIITYDLNNRITDSYRLLRTRILQRMNDNEWTLLGITSPESDSGKTVTAINLAIALSMDVNRSVILVDCHLRSPGVANALGLDEDFIGLIEYLSSNDEDFRHFLVKPQINNLYILPCEKKDAVASEILTSPKMRSFLNELKTLGSCIVLFDLPPVLVGDDVIAFSANLDAIMLVVEDGKTNSNDLSQAAQLLERTPLLGSVLNKSQHSPIK